MLPLGNFLDNFIYIIFYLIRKNSIFIFLVRLDDTSGVNIKKINYFNISYL